MTTPPNIARPGPIPLSALVPFVMITFGLSWGILALFITLPQAMTAIFGPLTGQHPLFYLAVWSPAIAACLIILSWSGWLGLQAELKRLLWWRCSLAWWIFVLAGVPLIFYAGSAVKGNLFSDPLPFSSLSSLAAAFLLTVIKGPVEELGWRGLALPLLQRKFTPFWSGLILGVVWGGWHFPAFLLSGTQQSAWAFTPFFIGTVAVSLIMTALFNASRGGLLPVVVLHFQLINPLWPDAQPYDTLFFVAAAGLVVCLNRASMFKKGAVSHKSLLYNGL